MQQLTILSGAGINLGVSAACPFAHDMLNFTYQKVSKSVYQRIEDRVRDLFNPESFDYILGGLLTVNLAIEKTKQSLKRFNMNEAAFAQIFLQPELQSSVARALEQLEEQLNIPLDQMLEVVTAFTPAMNKIVEKYDAINYFTLNFDGIFDHILYGPRYSRIDKTTDFWTAKGKLDQRARKQIKIYHLHGDLRYKPFKKTRHNNPPYRWPVLVVGDAEVKKGIIAANESLRFYNNRFKVITEDRADILENVLVIIGFGFRPEDDHIISRLRHGISEGVFDRILIYDPEDRLAGISKDHTWVSPQQESLIAFLGRI